MIQEEQQWRDGSTLEQSPRRRECRVVDEMLPVLRENKAYLQALGDNWNIDVPSGVGQT